VKILRRCGAAFVVGHALVIDVGQPVSQGDGRGRMKPERHNRERAEMPERKPTRLLAAVAFAVLAVSLTSAGAETDSMKIRITINAHEIAATLIDNATSRDFVSLLPLTLKLEDYGEIEKISYLPRKLSTANAPAGSEPSAGDVSYYAPWGNLALFRRDFRYSGGLIKLGKIDSGLDALNIPGSVEVTIDRIR
jgi:hypothetical protein